MHDMNNIVFERYYNEIERDDLRVRYSNEMASLIRDLTKNIKKAQVKSESLKLNPKEKEEFLELSRELGSFAPKFEGCPNSPSPENNISVNGNMAILTVNDESEINIFLVDKF